MTQFKCKHGVDQSNELVEYINNSNAISEVYNFIGAEAEYKRGRYLMTIYAFTDDTNKDRVVAVVMLSEQLLSDEYYLSRIPEEIANKIKHATMDKIYE